MILHRNAVRRISRWLMGVWLFALSQGLAHACLLQERGLPHGHEEPTTASRGFETGHVHEPVSSGAEELCQQTCDATQSALPKALSVPLLALDAVIPFDIFTAFEKQVERRDQGAEHPAPDPGPPPSIRFLRLIL